MKNTHNHTKLLSLIFIILVCFFLWKIIYAKQAYNKTETPITPSVQQLKTFQSKLMKFSISAPYSFQIDEKQTGIILNSNHKSIIVARSSTEAQNIKGHVDNIMKHNNTILSGEKRLKIDNYEAISGAINYNDNESEKIIYIFVDGWIYDISTSSPELFDDLDQIAKSFRYTP